MAVAVPAADSVGRVSAAVGTFLDPSYSKGLSQQMPSSLRDGTCRLVYPWACCCTAKASDSPPVVPVAVVVSAARYCSQKDAACTGAWPAFGLG